MSTFKQSAGRFVDRVRQNAAEQALDQVVVEGSVSARSGTAGHSYRVPATKTAGKIVRDGGVAGNAKVPKVPAIVMKQQTMIKESNKKSPFLTERQSHQNMDERIKISNLVPQSLSRRERFLPLELFDPYPDQDLETIQLRLSDPEDDKCYAYSRWLLPSGQEPELRRCEVLEFQPEKELFVIRWLHNEQCKKVSRFNLIFEREDRVALERRI